MFYAELEGIELLERLELLENLDSHLCSQLGKNLGANVGGCSILSRGIGRGEPTSRKVAWGGGVQVIQFVSWHQ